MTISKYQKTAQEILALADIQVNGSRPWDIQVHNPQFYQRVLAGGSLALGESYMSGWWDCKALDQFFDKVLRAKLDKHIKANAKLLFYVIQSKVFNRQSISRAFEVGEKHYDNGNDLYQAMLDKRMTYTCGYWKNAKTLDEAQEAKLELVCKKLGLKKGDKILDIGCGWGSFLKYAAEKYGVKGVGLTVSKEQAELARKLYKGLPIEIRLQDYREINEQFDHIISLGMFEHVGVKNYRTYFEIVSRCLKPEGLFLLHTIGGNESVTKCDPWFDKYIFPNGMLPSVQQIGKASEKFFIMEDWHNFGADYDKTLLCWFRNFNNHWKELKATGKYDDRFYRMWQYYLLSVAGGFRSRNMQLWQIIFSKKGVQGGYQSIR